MRLISLTCALGLLSCGPKAPPEAAPAAPEAAPRAAPGAEFTPGQGGWSGGVQGAATPDCPPLQGKGLQGATGSRKMAVVVGVGDYLFEPKGKSIDLQGPTKDARRIRDLLVGDYGYPADNVCMLLDGAATTDNVERAFTEHLSRASQGDAVVYFFAGHGSQVSDWEPPGQDETDGLDETQMLHDSRMNADSTPYDLTDDRFNAMLAGVHAQTQNVTVLLDACNSGSATRGDGAVKRQAIKLEVDKPAGYNQGQFGTYSPTEMPGLLYITAARDGTSALEKKGEGVFTNALLFSLREATGPLTYNQLTRSIPRHISTQNSYQVATFGGDQGAMNREVFGSKVRERPVSWNVAQPPAGETVTFTGPAMPGWSVGGEVALYDGATTRDEVAAGKAPKATARITAASPFEATGTILSGAGVTDQDIAVLTKAGQSPRKLKVKVDADVPGRDGLLKAFADDDVFQGIFEVVDDGYDFVLAKEGGGVAIYGDEGERRNLLTGSAGELRDQVLERLDLFGRQRELIALNGEAGTVYQNNQTLKVTLRPQAKQDGCPKDASFTGSSDPLVEVPMCTRTELVVELTQQPQKPLNIGVLYLSNDGEIYVWPKGGDNITLAAEGEQHVVKLGRASPPLNKPDVVAVFGTHEAKDWYLMGVPGKRGLDLDEEEEDAGPDPWTSSMIQLRNVADASQWSQGEMQDPTVCKVRKQAYKDAGNTCTD